MFSFICGNPVDYTENAVVIENGGIGWLLFVTPYTAAKCRGSERIQLFTHMAVREDDVSLFGFWCREERDMFLRLNGISGIGAKTALAILSGISHIDMQKAVVMQDVKLLSSVKGVGKKTAERIILELKDKAAEAAFDGSSGAAVSGEAANAAEALIGLGLTRGEAQEAVSRVTRGAEDMTAEQIIKAALKGR